MSVTVYTPQSMPELFADLERLTPRSKLISGGTDLIIRLQQGTCKPDALLYPGNIPGIGDITETADSLEIGAMVTMTALANSELMSGYTAAIKHAAADVGAVQIRNSATIGGNLGNASPAGDLMPVWCLLKAEAVIAGPGGALRQSPVAEVFLGPGKISLSYNEIIVRFVIPKAPTRTVRSAFVKLGYRKALTISRIGLAALLDTDESGRVTQFELLAGAISPTPVRVEQAARYLPGRQLSSGDGAVIGKCLSELILEITPEMFDRDYKAAAAFGVAEDLFAKLTE